MRARPAIATAVASSYSPKQTFQQLRQKALNSSEGERILRPFFQQAILRHFTFEEALCSRIATKLAGRSSEVDELFSRLLETALSHPELIERAEEDLRAIDQRDPAWQDMLSPFLHSKGYIALQSQRFSHALWSNQEQELASAIWAQTSTELQVDIHPAVRIGRRVMIDHGTGVTIGETALIGSDVSILQDVLLGGTGTEDGRRHPVIEDGVLLGAGAQVLGPVRVGANAKIGAGSVVFENVPNAATAVGVPARILLGKNNARPALEMNQCI